VISYLFDFSKKKIEIKQLLLHRILKKKKMATNRTFTMLKPDSVEKGHIGAILEMINKAGFRIVALN